VVHAELYMTASLILRAEVLGSGVGANSVSTLLSSTTDAG